MNSLFCLIFTQFGRGKRRFLEGTFSRFSLCTDWTSCCNTSDTWQGNFPMAWDWSMEFDDSDSKRTWTFLFETTKGGILERLPLKTITYPGIPYSLAFLSGWSSQLPVFFGGICFLVPWRVHAEEWCLGLRNHGSAPAGPSKVSKTFEAQLCAQKVWDFSRFPLLFTFFLVQVSFHESHRVAVTPKSLYPRNPSRFFYCTFEVWKRGFLRTFLQIH